MTTTNALSDRELADLQHDFRFYVKERTAAVAAGSRPIGRVVAVVAAFVAAALVPAAGLLVPLLAGATLPGWAGFWLSTLAFGLAAAGFGYALTRFEERRNSRAYVQHLNAKISAVVAALSAAGHLPEPDGGYPTNAVRASKPGGRAGAGLIIPEGLLTDGWLLALFA